MGKKQWTNEKINEEEKEERKEMKWEKLGRKEGRKEEWGAERSKNGRKKTSKQWDDGGKKSEKGGRMTNKKGKTKSNKVGRKLEQRELKEVHYAMGGRKE